MMLRNILLGIAALLFVLAVAFSVQNQKWQHFYNGVHMGPNAIAGPASAGFAIAGGLTVIAAVIVHCFGGTDRR